MALSRNFSVRVTSGGSGERYYRRGGSDSSRRGSFTKKQFYAMLRQEQALKKAQREEALRLMKNKQIEELEKYLTTIGKRNKKLEEQLRKETKTQKRKINATGYARQQYQTRRAYAQQFTVTVNGKKVTLAELQGKLKSGSVPLSAALMNKINKDYKAYVAEQEAKRKAEVKRQKDEAKKSFTRIEKAKLEAGREDRLYKAFGLSNKKKEIPKQNFFTKAKNTVSYIKSLSPNQKKIFVSEVLEDVANKAKKRQNSLNTFIRKVQRVPEIVTDSAWYNKASPKVRKVTDSILNFGYGYSVTGPYYGLAFFLNIGDYVGLTASNVILGQNFIKPFLTNNKELVKSLNQMGEDVNPIEKRSDGSYYFNPKKFQNIGAAFKGIKEAVKSAPKGKANVKAIIEVTKEVVRDVAKGKKNAPKTTFSVKIKGIGNKIKAYTLENLQPKDYARILKDAKITRLNTLPKKPSKATFKRILQQEGITYVEKTKTPKTTTKAKLTESQAKAKYLKKKEARKIKNPNQKKSLSQRYNDNTLIKGDKALIEQIKQILYDKTLIELTKGGRYKETATMKATAARLAKSRLPKYLKGKKQKNLLAEIEKQNAKRIKKGRVAQAKKSSNATKDVLKDVKGKTGRSIGLSERKLRAVKNKAKASIYKTKQRISKLSKVLDNLSKRFSKLNYDSNAGRVTRAQTELKLKAIIKRIKQLQADLKAEKVSLNRALSPSKLKITKAQANQIKLFAVADPISAIILELTKDIELLTKKLKKYKPKVRRNRPKTTNKRKTKSPQEISEIPKTIFKGSRKPRIVSSRKPKTTTKKQPSTQRKTIPVSKITLKPKSKLRQKQQINLRTKVPQKNKIRTKTPNRPRLRPPPPPRKPPTKQPPPNRRTPPYVPSVGLKPTSKTKGKKGKKKKTKSKAKFSATVKASVLKIKASKAAKKRKRFGATEERGI